MQHNLELYRLKAELCKAFADANRLVILDQLKAGEKSVNELVRTLEIPQAAVSRHLAILRERGVVKTRREGTSVYYSLTDPYIGEACELVHQILLNQIDKTKVLADSLTEQASRS